MIELLVLIIGVVAIWRFSGSIEATSVAGEQLTKTWAEGIIKDAVIERQEINLEFDKDLKDFKEANPEWNGKVISSEQLRKKFGIE